MKTVNFVPYFFFIIVNNGVHDFVSSNDQIVSLIIKFFKKKHL